jgi:hypothetical protein
MCVCVVVGVSSGGSVPGPAEDGAAVPALASSPSLETSVPLPDGARERHGHVSPCLRCALAMRRCEGDAQRPTRARAPRKAPSGRSESDRQINRSIRRRRRGAAASTPARAPIRPVRHMRMNPRGPSQLPACRGRLLLIYPLAAASLR